MVIFPNVELHKSFIFNLSMSIDFVVWDVFSTSIKSKGGKSRRMLRNFFATALILSIINYKQEFDPILLVFAYSSKNSRSAPNVFWIPHVDFDTCFQKLRSESLKKLRLFIDEFFG
jgi:hypothetical protein